MSLRHVCGLLWIQISCERNSCQGRPTGHLNRPNVPVERSVPPPAYFRLIRPSPHEITCNENTGHMPAHWSLYCVLYLFLVRGFFVFLPTYLSWSRKANPDAWLCNSLAKRPLYFQNLIRAIQNNYSAYFTLNGVKYIISLRLTVKAFTSKILTVNLLKKYVYFLFREL
jgi:hypothetical protein